MRALLHKQPPLNDDDFAFLAKVVYDACGVVLAAEHRNLVINRLSTVLEREGLETFAAYSTMIAGDKSGRLVSELVTRISTNHTFFNREPAHFEFLKDKVLPPIIAKARATHSKKLRLWCAACSTGQEAYMLLMVMREVIGPDYVSWDAGALATDVSDRVLEVTRAGEYPNEQLQKLPAPMRNRYFEATAHGTMRAHKSLRDELTVRRFNLVGSQQKFREPFDVIFCRNVLIYFDIATRTKVGNRLHDATRPGGYLFVGSAESLPGQHGYTQVAAGVYQRRA